MRRVLDRNSDMIGEMRAAMPTSEQFSVFRAYLDSRITTAHGRHDGARLPMMSGQAM